MHFDRSNLELALGLAAAAWALLGAAVAMGWCDRFDRAVMAWLPGGLADAPRARVTRIDTMMRDVSSLGSDTVRAIFLVACSGGLAITGNLEAAVAFAAIALGARLFVLVLKRLIARERPPAHGHAVPTYTTSFPSGHTLMATVMLLSAAALLTAGGSTAAQIYAFAFAAVLSLAIGLARMYLRVHWASDVLAGWLAAGAWVAGSLLVVDRLAR